MRLFTSTAEILVKHKGESEQGESVIPFRQRGQWDRSKNSVGLHRYGFTAGVQKKEGLDDDSQQRAKTLMQDLHKYAEMGASGEALRRGIHLTLLHLCLNFLRMESLSS